MLLSWSASYSKRRQVTEAGEVQAGKIVWDFSLKLVLCLKIVYVSGGEHLVLIT